MTQTYYASCIMGTAEPELPPLKKSVKKRRGWIYEAYSRSGDFGLYFRTEKTYTVKRPISEEKAPAVICVCGNATFTITKTSEYDDYDYGGPTALKCTQCGMEGES